MNHKRVVLIIIADLMAAVISVSCEMAILFWKVVMDRFSTMRISQLQRDLSI